MLLLKPFYNAHPYYHLQFTVKMRVIFEKLQYILL